MSDQSPETQQLSVEQHIANMQAELASKTAELDAERESKSDQARAYRELQSRKDKLEAMNVDALAKIVRESQHQQVQQPQKDVDFISQAEQIDSLYEDGQITEGERNKRMTRLTDAIIVKRAEEIAEKKFKGYQETTIQKTREERAASEFNEIINKYDLASHQKSGSAFYRAFEQTVNSYYDPSQVSPGGDPAVLRKAIELTIRMNPNLAPNRQQQDTGNQPPAQKPTPPVQVPHTLSGDMSNPDTKTAEPLSPALIALKGTLEPSTFSKLMTQLAKPNPLSGL